MEFQTLKCPSCAGELNPPPSEGPVKCSYCGCSVAVNGSAGVSGRGVEPARGGTALKAFIFLVLAACVCLFFYYWRETPPAELPKAVQNFSSGKLRITVTPAAPEVPFMKPEAIVMKPGLYNDESAEKNMTGDWGSASGDSITIRRNGELYELRGRSGNYLWKGYGQLWNKKLYCVYYFVDKVEAAYLTCVCENAAGMRAGAVDASGKALWSSNFEKTSGGNNIANAAPALPDESVFKARQGLYDDKAFDERVAGEWIHRPEGTAKLNITIRKNGEIFNLTSDNRTNQWKGIGQLCGYRMCVMLYYTNTAEAAFITLDFSRIPTVLASAFEPDGKLRWSGGFGR